MGGDSVEEYPLSPPWDERYRRLEVGPVRRQSRSDSTLIAVAPRCDGSSARHKIDLEFA
jgi:hypothetical protein